uniref:Uncharacterized protein n=1 Tax=Myoviridae sp. ctjH82 TaxID=2827704 RepID=A0A8S5T7J6_9CAUD|nr:MAG TPA: hypothetical protein [Myoviridae sp. ctjH82]
MKSFGQSAQATFLFSIPKQRVLMSAARAVMKYCHSLS